MLFVVEFLLQMVSFVQSMMLRVVPPILS